MKDLNLNQLRQGYDSGDISYSDLLELLKTDSRRGLIQLIDSIRRQRQRERDMIERHNRMMEYEKQLHRQGRSFVAGLDEVGRGPLAGPVVTAAVILDPDKPIYGLRDSKKLSHKQRVILADEIYHKAICISIDEQPAEMIDRINILQATKTSMLMAIKGLSQVPDHLLIDALTLDCPIPQTAIIKGDDQSCCISAASIVAKVYRDQRMYEYHQKYPEYGFDHHVGYGTAEHIAAIRRHGPSPIHRRSFLTNFL